MLRYSVGVGVGVMRVSGRCFVALLARHTIPYHAQCSFTWLPTARHSIVDQVTAIRCNAF